MKSICIIMDPEKEMMRRAKGSRKNSLVSTRASFCCSRGALTNAHRRALLSDLPVHRGWCWHHPDEHDRRVLHRAPPERRACGATALSWRVRHATTPGHRTATAAAS